MLKKRHQLQLELHKYLFLFIFSFHLTTHVHPVHSAAMGKSHNKKKSRRSNKKSLRDCLLPIDASVKGDNEIVGRLLVHPEMDVNKANDDGGTALTIASQKGHTEVVERLLAHPDIDVNKALTNGGTALFVASHEGHTEVVDRLLAHPDIDVNKAETTDGHTALVAASLGGHTEIVEQLLAGLDFNNAMRSDRRRALFIASKKGFTKIVALLKVHKKKRKKTRKTCVHCNKVSNERLNVCELCRRPCCADCHMAHLVLDCPNASKKTHAAVARKLHKENVALEALIFPIQLP